MWGVIEGVRFLSVFVGFENGFMGCHKGYIGFYGRVLEVL